MEKEKTKNNQVNCNVKGITLVALVVTLIVLLILAGVTITSLLGDNGIIKKAQEAANAMDESIKAEQNEINALIEELNSTIIGNTSGGDDTTEDEDDTVEMPSGWDEDKVEAVKSDDGEVVPVPIGFTKSTVAGEGSVETGFVIKQGDDGSLTEGINEFVWVPVSDPYNTMFGLMFESGGNEYASGKLYDFSTGSPQPLNWTEAVGIMNWTSDTSNREPDIVTWYDGNDATINSNQFVLAIGNITGAQFKTQLRQEFLDMQNSVLRYGGFYIGRYETGDLLLTKAVVQKNNTDINAQTWYRMYKKCKTIAEGTQGTTSMIWGCQWDATMKWFLESSDPEVVEYVTNSTDKGNYSTDKIPTGSNDDYSVNKIYDMAGNVYDWTIEADSTDFRVCRRR